MRVREYTVKEHPKRQPSHPGALSRDEIIPDMRVSVSHFARNIRVSRQLLYGILKEEKPITPSVALKLGKYIGNGPNLWLRMQQAYDL